MTTREALAEAQRRFGKNAFVQELRLPGRLSPFSHFVGVWQDLFTPLTRGSGPSWEAAFADADRREGGSPSTVEFLPNGVRLRVDRSEPGS